MSNDGVDGTDLIDGIEFFLVINGSFVWPIDIGVKGSVWLLKMEMLGAHPIRPIDGGCTTHTENGVSAGFDHGIVG